VDSLGRLRRAASALAIVVVIGTIGYVILDFSWLDALYQTTTTITTVGFREVEPLSSVGKWFTMVLIVAGVGTALYTLSVLIGMLVEGDLNQARKRKRMARQIEDLRGHVIVCGWGRVGKALARYVVGAGEHVVVIDQDPERLDDHDDLHVLGDATDDAVLKTAGIDRARALVAAIDTDAENLYVTLSGRSLRPDLFIVARARDAASDSKLLRAGADRVVNPQAIGGARMAAFVLQPHVAEFLDVVMHDGSLEFRLEELEVPEGSPLTGGSLRHSQIRDRTGALVLAVRDKDGTFVTNPAPDTVLKPGQVLIAIGTSSELAALAALNAV
jgi:voltage-gated potassium channel